MSQKTFAAQVDAALSHIKEVLPWDLQAMRQADPDLLVVDIREADEYATGYIQGSLLVPRGILEAACDWGYSDTCVALAQARTKPVVLVCRSGNRTALAAITLQQMGFKQVYSLKTGVRGWNDYDLPLINATGEPVDGDLAAELLSPPVRPEQMQAAASNNPRP